MIASPCDAVNTFVLRPMVPRDGISKSMFTLSPCVSMPVISPLRRVTMSIILLENSSGTLIFSSSTGSHFTPSISLYITCGCPTCSSYPSRLIVSMSTDRCSTPLPLTTHLSVLSPNGSTLSAKFFSVSRARRSLMCLDVTYLPSLPKKGESLMVNSIDIVGSSTEIVGSASGSSASQIVSPISKFDRPITAQISPDVTSSVAW